MADYRLDLRPILDEVGGSLHISDTLDMTELVVGDVRFQMVEAPAFDVTVSNAGEAFVAMGSITARAATSCVRCLREFETTIPGEVDGLWARSGFETADDDEPPPMVDHEGWIDLEPALVAALVVEAPFAPLHDAECAGLCPTCGADLNLGQCGCGEKPNTEHPFAELKKLLDQDDAAGGVDSA